MQLFSLSTPIQQKKVQLFALLVRHPLLSDLLLAFLWLLLWRASSLMEYEPHASIWFPPAGLTFTAVLLLGLRAIPVVACCCLVSTFWEDIIYGTAEPAYELLASGALFALAHILAYSAGALLLKRICRRGGVEHLPSMLLAFTLIAPASALFAGYFTQQALMIGGVIEPGAEDTHLWLLLWVGDLIGILVLTPLFIGLIRLIYPQSGDWVSETGLRQTSPCLIRFLAKLLFASALLLLVMFVTAQLRIHELAFVIFFLGIPQMWIVFTETPLRSGVSIAVLSSLTAILVKQFGFGEDALIYQFSMSVLAASTYYGLLVPVLATSNSHLKELTRKDALTCASSRQHFFNKADEELQRARFYRQPVSLVIFDIDHFKHINDNYGHSVGDMALIALAKLVAEKLRQADLLGRFGGDEFMMLLPGCKLTESVASAERIRQELQQVSISGVDHQLSGSFGVTEVQADESLQQAFDRADAFLLQAKRQGRDQVVADPLP